MKSEKLPCLIGISVNVVVMVMVMVENNIVERCLIMLNRRISMRLMGSMITKAMSISKI